jgi:L-lactate dehydrogenase (cytochrome)
MYRANERDLHRILLRQRVAVNIAHCGLRIRILDQEIAMPVAIAPTGLAGMLPADGEILAARAAKQCGILFAPSTVSICSIEDVAEPERMIIRSGSSIT